MKTIINTEEYMSYMRRIRANAYEEIFGDIMRDIDAMRAKEASMKTFNQRISEKEAKERIRQGKQVRVNILGEYFK